MKADLQAQLVRDLVIESTEGLDQFDRELLALERGSGTADTLHALFRIIHSLKGTSGCLGLTRLSTLAHAGENLLSLMREGKRTATPQVVSTLLRYADALREMLGGLGQDGREIEADHSALLAELEALTATSEVASAVAAWGLFEAEPAPPAAAEPAAPQPMPKPAEPAAPSCEGAIRVDVEQLDNLMDLVGELVLARNQIVQLSDKRRDLALASATQRLNMITSKLQDSVMKTRMQPIGNLWSKYPRIVRDLAKECGREIDLAMDGSETELDRTILEGIKDPLTHLIRNAVDHGIESPEKRLACGKPVRGLLKLRAFHDGGQVVIEISDDGAGIDRERVLRKAEARGLVTPEQAERMSDRDVYGLLFTAGFSTAEKVTNVSGRGVGMDVVKKNVERIGGMVEIQSEPGRSTTVRVTIPLTLAIIPALIAGCAGNRYAIPQASVLELVRLEADRAAGELEQIANAPVYRLRGNLLPVVYLRRQLYGENAPEYGGSSVYLMVLQADGQQFGLVVDSIQDTQEIVVKPLGKELKDTAAAEVYAGATIMGDGRVALILDVPGIARRAHIGASSQDAAAGVRTETGAQASDSRQGLLLLAAAEGTQAAVPLSQVARLEVFPRSLVERAGNSEVVQYRGAIMPLVRLASVMGIADRHDDAAALRVVVVLYEGMNVGLVVDRILDTVETEVSLQRCSNRPGVLGSAIVGNRVTDFLDLGGLVEASGVVRFAA